MRIMQLYTGRLRIDVECVCELERPQCAVNVGCGIPSLVFFQVCHSLHPRAARPEAVVVSPSAYVGD